MLSPVSHSKTTSASSNSHRLLWYTKDSPLVPHQLSICSQVRKPLVRCTVVQIPRHQDSACDGASVQAGYGNGPSLQATDVLLRILSACSGETEQVNAFATLRTLFIVHSICQVFLASNTELVQNKNSDSCLPVFHLRVQTDSLSEKVFLLEC